MIPLSEINNVAHRYQVPAETVEKDYVISWILVCLSKSQLKNDFIFYGGTAIKRIYFEDHRFSEDIDLFSTHHFSQNYLLQALDVLQYARDNTNLILGINRDTILATKSRVQLLIRYSGYDEIVGAPKEVRLDLAMGMHLYGDMTDRTITKSYGDLMLQNETLSVMTLNTILANKLGLLVDLTRNEPRDLFDIWFLLQRTDQFDFSFNQMCTAFKEKYGFGPSLSILIPCLRNRSLKTHWNVRLSKQVAALPDIDMVIKDIEVKLKKIFKDQ